MSSTTYLMLRSALLERSPAGGRVAANASGQLLGAEQKAQAAGRGVWRE